MGKAISPELFSAIRQSRLAIIVISPNYASSTWRLDELVKILECMELGQAVLPIFYSVDPSHVRKQLGSFAQPFIELEERFKDNTDKVERRRAALRKVASLKGWSSNDRHEPELIKEIVEEVRSHIRPTFLDSGEKLVGINLRLKQLDFLLNTESDDVRLIGIWGMGGIGKTTIAKIVYARILHKFEVSCFLDEVRQVCKAQGLVSLQMKLSQSLLNRKIKYWDIHEEATMRKFLSQKKVLVVLDDVDNISQLDNLCGHQDWFGPGSRIIITTRNVQLLIAHGVERRFEVPYLNKDDALQLLSLKAFKSDFPEKEFLSLSKHVVKYANGLPLALKVLGSFLYKRGHAAWSSALEKLKDGLNGEIMEALKVSFDGLDENEKNIFLDIACFFEGKYKSEVVQILDSCGFHSVIGIDILIEKSLLTIQHNKVHMHDLLQQMGRDIIRQQSEEPGEYSRLWLPKDIFHVLVNKTGTKAVQVIMLDFLESNTQAQHYPKAIYVEQGVCQNGDLQVYNRISKLHGQALPESKVVECHPKAFSKMLHLRFLKLHNLHLPQGLKYLPNSLRFIDWCGFPLRSLPPGFQPNELVELCMCHSHLKQLWNGIKHLHKLKVIRLSQSQHLEKTPDFKGVQNLERLYLDGCKTLVEIHSSVGVLKRLSYLNLHDCERLEGLPDEIEMDYLEVLILSGCSSVKKIPAFAGDMAQLRIIYLDGTAIETLPSSIARLTSLLILDLKGCANLVCLPNTIGSLKSLKNINLFGCSRLAKLPDSFGKLASLEMVDVSETALKEWPACFSLLRSIKSWGFPVPEGWSSPHMSLSFQLMPIRIRQPMSSFLPPLSRFFSLRELDLSEGNISKGANNIDISWLSSLVSLKLSGFSSFSLPRNSCPLFKLEKFYWSHLFQMGSYPGDRFEIVIPGSYIPWFFSHRQVGWSVTVELSQPWDHGERRGYALSAVFEVFGSGWELTCVFKANGQEQWSVPLLATNVKPVSDHLWLFFDSRDLRCGEEWKSSCNQLTFSFQSSGPCVVKKCGVLMVDEHEVEMFKKVMTGPQPDLVSEELLPLTAIVTASATTYASPRGLIHQPPPGFELVSQATAATTEVLDNIMDPKPTPAADSSTKHKDREVVTPNLDVLAYGTSF